MRKHYLRRGVLALAAAVACLAAASPAAATDVRVVQDRYVVILKGNAQQGLSAIKAAGGTVVHDMSKEIGVVIATSDSAGFAASLRGSAGIDEVGNDVGFKSYPSKLEAMLAGGGILSHPGDGVPGGGPEAHADPGEPLQWDMLQIRTTRAHATQAGARAVQVGILDSGIDADHLDFDDDGALGGPTNVDCTLARDFVPLGPGLGNGLPCEDNQFHGTHVAGTVAAQANGVGIVGVAPNVTLIPVKVCDTLGYCYSSSTVAGITYAGTAKFEVINMSFFVDDNEFLQSTEFKCMNDPVQRAFRKANERAIQYARQQGVVPVAALGNSDNDLAHPPEPYENNCEVVPAETQGVIGTMSLGPGSEKASYSNYGVGATDVAAPGGNSNSPYPEFPGPCGTQILSTFPDDLYACIQGTSMASPHAAGVAALIVSQFGRVAEENGVEDVVMPPQQVEAYLQATTVDIGLKGYDECFGHGRIDALKAVTHDTSSVFQVTPPCPEYEEGPQDNQ